MFYLLGKFNFFIGHFTRVSLRIPNNLVWPGSCQNNPVTTSINYIFLLATYLIYLTFHLLSVRISWQQQLCIIFLATPIKLSVPGWDRTYTTESAHYPTILIFFIYFTFDDLHIFFFYV